MVKVNELRVGNLIQWNTDPHEVVKIEGAHFNGFIEANFEGIPLAPEILEQCGFEKLTETMYRIMAIGLDWAMNLAYTGNGHMTESAMTKSNLKYLHQLQNLYFVLTGEELNIKL